MSSIEAGLPRSGLRPGALCRLELLRKSGWRSDRSNRWGLVPLLLLLIVGACAAPPSVEEVAAVDLSPVWEAWWQQELDGAIDAADAVGWDRAGSIAGERVRQSLRSRRGERPALVAELRSWRVAEPRNADLAYLEARLLQNPDRALQRFRHLAREHPRHPWIRLGLASLAQSDGSSSRAVRQLLAHAPRRADAAAFRRQIEARLLAQEGDWEIALARLEKDAFTLGDRDALYTWVEIASDAGRSAEERRGRAEIALRRLRTTDPLGLRVSAVGERALAEAATRPDLGLDDFLLQLDAWCARAGLETGWIDHPRYSIGPIGELVRPERNSGDPAAQWADAGYLLLAGEAVFHGLELLLLTGVERYSLGWPGEPEPLEIVVARQGLSSRRNLASGGTVFHGFYIREDLLREGARGMDQRAEQVILPLPAVDLSAGLDLDPDDRRLPEDWDLPLRIQARQLEGDSLAFELERELLLLHEAGHLPEVLRWLPAGPSFLRTLPVVLHSLVASGDAMTWLEYRAALRALAATPHPHWALADLVRTVRGGTPRYRSAYSWLLEDLIELGAEGQLPPFYRWDEIDPEVLTEMARQLCNEQGLELLPAEPVAELLRSVSSTKAD